MSDDQPTRDPFQFPSWTIELTNRPLDRIPDWPRTLQQWRDDPITIDAHCTIPRDAYTQFVGDPADAGSPEQLYTFEWTEDRNPWHRHAPGRHARLRKLRDGIWWTFQRRALRRELVETIKVTVPNCRIVPGAE